jgi:predicted nucleotide-binding protein (sugar kinase/HSP70/actin superfamily)
MLVERTNKEVIIRLPASVDTEDLQDFLNYARYKELTSNFKVEQKEVDKLAGQINAKWWTKNRKKLVK